MKHLKKKFVLKPTKPNDSVKKVLDNAQAVEPEEYENITQNIPDLFGLIETKEGELIQAFYYRSNNVDYLIPEPNPIVIYFETGRHYYKYTQATREALFKELDKEDWNVYEVQTRIYKFYATGSSCVTFLFTALEAFINKLIPHDYTYSKVINGETELYDQVKIQRHLSFHEKVKSVLPDIPELKNKAFHIQHGHKFDNIKKLKNFRDEIMHTKLINKTSLLFYRDLFTTALNFNYETAIYAARDFINYYEPNLIEECECGKDY